MTTEVRFERWFHIAALVALPSEELLGTIRCEPIRDVAEAFINNAKRITDAGVAPISMISWAFALQSWIDEACLDTWGDLQSRGTDDPKYSQYKEALGRRRKKYLNQAMEGSDEHNQRLWRGAGQIELFQQSDEIRAGLDAVLAGMVTGMWTAFEVLAGDLWEAALNTRPIGLADLKGKMPRSMPKPKRPFTALSDGEDARNSSKMVKLNYLQAHGYDLSRLMGTVLREKFNFQILESIRSAYLQAFDESCAPVREAILHPSLDVLAAARNVLTHKAGITDQDFMNDHARLEELRSVFPEAKRNEPLPITGHTVRNMLNPVLAQSSQLIEAVNRVVENHDEREDRCNIPDASTE